MTKTHPPKRAAKAPKAEAPRSPRLAGARAAGARARPVEPEVLAARGAGVPRAGTTCPRVSDGGIDATKALVRRDDRPAGLALARDALQAYMAEVVRHPLLTREEENALAWRYYKDPEHNVDAAYRLVTANLRLVVKLAYQYRRAAFNMLDLIQEGNIGLMQAVKKFDPDRGIKLSSYAAWWIRAYILRYVMDNFRLVKLGTTEAQRKLFFNLRKEQEKLAAQGIEPGAQAARRAPQRLRAGRRGDADAAWATRRCRSMPRWATGRGTTADRPSIACPPMAVAVDDALADAEIKQPLPREALKLRSRWTARRRPSSTSG